MILQPLPKWHNKRQVCPDDALDEVSHQYVREAAIFKLEDALSGVDQR